MLKDNRLASRGHWSRVLIIFIPFLLVAYGFHVLVNLLLGFQWDAELPAASAWEELLHTFSFAASIFLVVWVFRKYLDKESFRSLGFQQINRKEFSLGLSVGFLIMLAGYLILLFTDQIFYRKSNFIGVDFILSVFIYAFVALGEELLVRGYFLSNLLGSMNKYVALVLSALIFCLMHGLNQGFSWLPALVLFLSGIMLGLSYIYTRSLWFPVFLHFSWNFFQGTVFGFNVSGNYSYAIISQGRSENNLWNGGSFGFEGSILCVIFELLAILLIYRVFNPSFKSKASSSLTAQ